MDKIRYKKFDRFTFPFKIKTLLIIFCPYKLKFSSMRPVEILDYLGSESTKNSSLQSTTSNISISHESSEGITTIQRPFGSLKPINVVLETPKSIDLAPDRVKTADIDLKTLKSCMVGKFKADELYNLTKFVYFKNLRLTNSNIFQGSSKIDTLFRFGIPQQISWTRVDPNQEKIDKVPLREKVVMGVISGMVATTAVHPLDVIKVRLQLFPKKISTSRMLRRIVACEGQKGLYGGLTASWLRQITYTGSRLYLYNKLVEVHQRKHGTAPSFSERMRIAVVAGMAGAFAGTPADLTLVRIIETQRLRRSPCSPPCSAACKMFPTPINAMAKIFSIARDEGMVTLWRGGLLTVARSVFVSAAQVGVYNELKQRFAQHAMYGGIKLHVCSAACSSLVSAVLSLPVDQVKTRYQSYGESRRQVDSLKILVTQKGVMYLWKGFLPYYVRQFVHTVITYVLLDQLIDLYVDLVGTVPGK